MIIGFFGADGRALGSHAAALVAHAAAAAGLATTLLIEAGPDGMVIPRFGKLPEGLRVVESIDGDPTFVSREIRTAIAASATERVLVLDLPREWLASRAFEDVSLRVLAVGPSAMERSVAAAVVGRIAASLPDRVPRLLACGCGGGGPALRSFEAEMATAGKAAGLPPDSMQVLDCPMPTLWKTAATSPIEGSPDQAAIVAALNLLFALMEAAGDRRREDAPPVERLPDTVRLADTRGTPERLRDLADALDAAASGAYPTAADLSEAPLLDDWHVASRAVTALRGRVTGHPDFPPNQAVRTSEVYASDGHSFARTFSRLFRLGRPAGQSSGPLH